MASNAVKCLRAEKKSLQSLVSKLAATIETIHLQLKQKDDALAKRRSEVARLHQACAKYKRARAIAPVRRRPPDLQAARSTIKQAVLSSTSNVSTINDVALCSRCQQAKDVFGELKEAVDSFAEKLNAAVAEKEAQLSAALREKDDEIGKLVATLAERDRRDEERRQRTRRRRDEEIERDRQDYEDTIKEMAEMKERNQCKLERKFRKLDEDKLQQLRRIDLRLVVIQRQRTGVADAA